MELILHIGFEKTGTTSLQEFLFNNRKELSKSGIQLFDSFGKPNNRKLAEYFCVSQNNFKRMHGLNSQRETQLFFENLHFDFCNELAMSRGRYQYAIISSEQFHSQLRSREELTSLRDFLYQHFESVRIIAYVRDQFSFLKSLFSTYCRVSQTENFDRFISNAEVLSLADYLSKLRLWQQVFGQQNVCPYSWNTTKKTYGDIVSHFLELLPVDQKRHEFIFDEKFKNTGIEYLKCCAFIGINRAIPYFDENGVNPANKELKSIIGQANFPKTNSFYDQYQGQIFQRFNGINVELSEHFGDPTLLLFKERPAQEQISKTQIFSDTEINQAGQLVTEIVQEMAINLKDKIAAE